MASPVEMLMKQVFKAMNLEPEKVMGHIEEIRQMAVFGFQHAKQANERLRRIETHLGLSDIEPIPSIVVITHENLSSVPPDAQSAR